MKQQFKTLQIIHLAICAGPIVFFFIATDLKKFELLPNITNDNLLIAIIPLIAFILGNYIFRTRIAKINLYDASLMKFQKFQEISIIRWALFEGSAFVVLVLAPELSSLALFVVLYLIFTRPSAQNISDLLKIPYSEFN